MRKPTLTDKYVAHVLDEYVSVGQALRCRLVVASIELGLRWLHDRANESKEGLPLPIDELEEARKEYINYLEARRYARGK